jgi:hypothetical protein
MRGRHVTHIKGSNDGSRDVLDRKCNAHSSCLTGDFPVDSPALVDFWGYVGGLSIVVGDLQLP